MQQVSHENSENNLTAQNPKSIESHGSQKSQAGFDIRGRARTFHVCCERWCSCACHVNSTFRYPEWMRSSFGGLFVGYTGIPVFTPPCSEASCKQRSTPFIEVTYCFPGWFVSRVWSLNFRISAIGGPELNLRMPRMVNWSTPLWKASVVGDISTIQRLFASGKASPLDVNVYGQTALHVSA